MPLCPFQIYRPLGNVGDPLIPVNSGYGLRVHPVSGQTSMHHGIDIPAPKGTPVRAVRDGVVEWSYFSDTAGNLIKIKHDNGAQSNYMHLDFRLVDKGAPVRAGDVIGFVGSTGTATGDHLHLELKDANGQEFDPYQCYMASKWQSPYGRPMPGTEEYEKQQRRWIWWAAGAGALLIGGIIIIAATRDEDKRTARQAKRQAKRLTS